VTLPQIYLAAIIVIALGLIATNRLRADLVALILLLAVAIPTFDGKPIVSSQEAISGFSRESVITIIGLFMMTSALERAGVSRLMADHLLRMGAGSEARLVFLFTTGAALLSLFMNNVAAGAVLLPTAVNVTRRSQIPPSRLLMPLAFGTLLGGMATYFTTANILVSNTLRERQLTPLGILDFTPTGGVVAIAGIAFMIAIGRRLLPVRAPAAQYAPNSRTTAELEKVYELEERLWEAQVLPNSPLAGATLGTSAIGQRLGVTVVGIRRGSHAILNPAPDESLKRDDILLVAGREDRVSQLAAQGLKIERTSDGRTGISRMPRHGVSLTEVIVAPHSRVEDQSLKDLNFRQKFGLTAVALWRDGRSYRTDVGDFKLQFGDALLMFGPPDRINILRSEPDFIVLGGMESRVLDRRRAALAVSITTLVLAIAATGLMSIAAAMILGIVLMALTGCIALDEGYRAVEWRAIFLIAGMLPVSIAMRNTQLADLLGQTLVNTLRPLGPLGVIGGLYLFTVLVSQVMSGQVTALVLAPIAISAALQINTSPQAAGLAVAIGCSTSFLTPIAHPVNVLMMGPGGYTFGDFVKVGWGLTLVCFVALLIALPLFWKL
jgi:di/tricarboxylate transporter